MLNKKLLLLLYLGSLGQQFLFVSILPLIQQIGELEGCRHIFHKLWEEIRPMWKWVLRIRFQVCVFRVFHKTFAFLAQIRAFVNRVYLCFVLTAFFTVQKVYVKWIELQLIFPRLNGLFQQFLENRGCQASNSIFKCINIWLIKRLNMQAIDVIILTLNDGSLSF